MRTMLIAAASAIFVAAVIVELSSRLWPGSYLALLLVAFVGLFFNGLFNRKLATDTPAPAATRAKSGRSRNRGADRQRPRDGSGGGRGARSSETADSRPKANDGPRENGEVKWFNRNKGFGFIIRESGEEIFVHQRSIRLVGEGENRRRPGLRDGQAVNFQVAERDKGIQAEDVVASD
ncbi:MAG: cold shock domain-containing protein [Gammaproteobacteria bacterium]|nr:cold shock domain-containing protein [Gammaproteobacteria bacterium]